METQVGDFDLIATVRDAAKYGDKIDALIKAKKEYEKAKDDAEKSAADYAKKKIEIDNYVNGRKAELEAAQKKHDAAAAEVADRIKLNQTQVDEVLKVKNDNAAATLDLQRREGNLAARERLLKDQQSGIADRAAENERNADLIRRQQAHIAAMPKQ